MIARLRAFAGSPAGRAVGVLFGLGLIALLLVRLRNLWQTDPVPLDRASVPLLVAALVASAVAMTGYGLVWPAALRIAGGTPPGSMLAPFYAGQLGKYLPGGVFQWIGRAGLIMRAGVPAGPAAGSLVLEAVASAAAAALLAPLVLGPAGVGAAVAAAVLVLVASRIGSVGQVLRRVPGLGGLDLRALPSLVARYVGAWCLFGIAFWLAARALYQVPIGDVVRYTGAFAAAWIVGFLVVFVPGGIGVREAVLVALLRGRIGEAEALVLATTSRIAFTLVDLVAGVPALVAVRRAHRAASTDSR